MAERSSLVRLEEDFEVEIDWRGFELHPETPVGGKDIVRPGGDERKDFMRDFAARFGITDMKSTTHLPNTRKPMAMAQYARDMGKLDGFRELVMAAHWKDGKNIEDDSVLRELAVAAGLDPEAALNAATDPEYLKRVDAMRLEFEDVETGGVPTFLIGDYEIVEGCKPYEAIVEAVVRAGARPK